MLTPKLLTTFRRKPDLYIDHILGCKTLEDYQREICRLFAEHDNLAIKACHSVGKTFLLARLAHAFLNCYANSKVITTAPTHRQVVTLLWGELRKAHKHAPVYLNGKLNQASLYLDDDWFAMGFSTRHEATASTDDGQKGSSFQGFHAKYILIVFDEATGIPKDIYTMAEGLRTSGVIVKWVCIANPTTRASEFFKICTRATWKVHTVNCFDSPNLKANGFYCKDDLRAEIDILRRLPDMERLSRIRNYNKPNPFLITAQWVVEKLYEWGFDHPLALSKIFGEFPEMQDNVIVAWENIQKAMDRDIMEDTEQLNTPRYIGVDVARFGDDLTVITEIQGHKWIRKEAFAKKDTIDTTGNVVHAFRLGNTRVDTHIVVDGTGVGSGVVDNLKDLKRDGTLPPNVYIHEVHFAQAVVHWDQKKEAELRKDYENLKAFMFDKLNEDLRDHLDLSREEIYEEELAMIFFKYSKKDRLMVESKDEFKARTGKSPDHSDSLALANIGRHLAKIVGKFEKLDPEKSKPYRKRPGEFKSRIKIPSY